MIKNNESSSGELNLEKLLTVSPIVKQREQWINVIEQTKNHVMPPEDEQQPKLYKELEDIAEVVEDHYKDMQDIEFTVQEGKLYMLQTRVGKRTAAASLKIAIDMVKEGLIDKKEAIMRIDPDQIEQLMETIKGMTVIELNELVKALEEEFGVSAAAAAPVREASTTSPPWSAVFARRWRSSTSTSGASPRTCRSRSGWPVDTPRATPIGSSA